MRRVSYLKTKSAEFRGVVQTTNAEFNFGLSRLSTYRRME